MHANATATEYIVLGCMKTFGTIVFVKIYNINMHKKCKVLNELIKN